MGVALSVRCCGTKMPLRAASKAPLRHFLGKPNRYQGQDFFCTGGGTFSLSVQKCPDSITGLTFLTVQLPDQPGLARDRHVAKGDAGSRSASPTVVTQASRSILSGCAARYASLVRTQVHHPMGHEGTGRINAPSDSTSGHGLARAGDLVRQAAPPGNAADVTSPANHRAHILTRANPRSTLTHSCPSTH